MKLQNTTAAVQEAKSKFVSMHAVGRRSSSSEEIYGTVVDVRLGISGTVFIDINRHGHIYVCDSKTVELMGNP